MKQITILLSRSAHSTPAHSRHHRSNLTRMTENNNNNIVDAAKTSILKLKKFP